jgi:HD-like signal output (HDOD) protein
MDSQTYMILFTLILLVVYVVLRTRRAKPPPKVNRVIRQPRKRMQPTGKADNRQVTAAEEQGQAKVQEDDDLEQAVALDGWKPLKRGEIEVETVWRLEHAIRDMQDIGRDQMVSVDFNLEPKDLAGILASNPFYAGKILKTVNSAAIGLRTRIDSLQRAITFLGYNQVKNIVFQHMVDKGLASGKGELGEHLDLLRFWMHSHAVSICAEYLLRDVIGKPQQIGVITTAALLHDIGWVVFDRYDSQCAQALYSRLSGEESEPEPMKVEQELFGFNHLIAGSLLAEHWEIPATVCEMIELHHCSAFGLDTDVGREVALGACVVAKAEQLSARMGFSNPLSEPYELSTDLSPVIGLKAAGLESAPVKLKGEVEKTMKFIAEFNRN